MEFSTWRCRPLRLEILRALNEKGGFARDIDLYDVIKREYDVSFSQFLKELLSLELRGLIHVRYQKENVRLVELTQLGKRARI